MTARDEHIPSRALLGIDTDVAAWLRAVADRDYSGDRAAALNAILRAAMTAEQAPRDPWAGLNQRRDSRHR